jgi:hypothetical protein
MSKYDSLTKFLLGQPPGPVTMTFTQMNSLLGFSMPAAAHKYQSWWADKTDQNTRHRQCRSRLNANRKVAADLKHGVVTFFQQKTGQPLGSTDKAPNVEGKAAQ